MIASSDGPSGEEDRERERRRKRVRARIRESIPILSDSLDRRAVVRWIALLSPLIVPWVIVRTTGTTLVFPWGLVTLETGTVVTLPTYLDRTAGLPQYLRLWPVGVACYAFALVWAAGERHSADQRVTAGLFGLVAVSATWMASGLAADPNRVAIPLASVHALALALWLFALRD